MSSYPNPQPACNQACILAVTDNPRLAAELLTIATANGNALQIIPLGNWGYIQMTPSLWIIDRQLMGKDNWNLFCATLGANSPPLVIIDRGVGRQNTRGFKKPRLPAGKVFFVNQNALSLVGRLADALLKCEKVTLGSLIEELIST